MNFQGNLGTMGDCTASSTVYIKGKWEMELNIEITMAGMA